MLAEYGVKYMECNCKKLECGTCFPPLIATFYNITGTCSCFNEISFALNWNGYEWVGNFTINKIKYIFMLSCVGHLWTLLGVGSDDSSLFQMKIPAESLTPTLILFKDIKQIDCCDGTFQIYITS